MEIIKQTVEGYVISSLEVTAVLVFITWIVMLIKSKDEELSVINFFSILLGIIYYSILVNLVFTYDFKITKEKGVEFINQPLVSLKSVTNTEGDSFAIYTGEKYSGFIKKDGGFIKYTMPGDSLIYETSKKEPHYSVVCDEIKEYENNNMINSKVINCKSYLYVPSNSIERNFKIN